MSKGVHAEDLPDSERAAWQSLWRDLDELAMLVAKKHETKATQKKPNPRVSLSRES